MAAADEPLTTPAPAKRTGKTRTLTAHAVAVSVALFLGSAGVLKLSGYPPLPNPYIQAGQPYWVLYGSGFIECVCSIGLFIPRTRIYASWVLLSMILLVAWKPWSVQQASLHLASDFRDFDAAHAGLAIKAGCARESGPTGRAPRWMISTT